MKAFIILLALSLKAFGYPVFFQCKDSRIISKGAMDDQDLFKKIMKMDKSKRVKLASSWCRGSKECLKDFEFIVELAGANYQAAMELYKKQLEKFKDRGVAEVSSLGLEEAVGLKESYDSIRACQESKVALEQKDFVAGDRVLTPYPFYSNYMYASGCKRVGPEECNPISKDKLDRVIEESVLMGVDPYLVLAFSLMEGGTEEVGRLYLDPVGVMHAIGCSGKQIANGAKPGKALNSYGTSFMINSAVKGNEKVQSNLSAYFSAFDISKEEGQSYYCYDVTGDGAPSVTEYPKRKACCLELGFKTTNESDDVIAHALTYQFIEKITKNKFKEKEDPAFRAQRYNGYTNLMGAAEGVSPWRAGVNYYKDPAYGYQTMDLILNALMFNPYISAKVSEVNVKHGATWKSILCRGKKDGVYHLDSDYYFEKHKNSARMSSIHEKFKKGKGLGSLSTRERNVLVADMEETSGLNEKMNNLLPEANRIEIENKLSAMLSEVDWDIQTDLANKDTWKAEMLKILSLKEDVLDDIYLYEKTTRELIKQERELFNKRDKVMDEAQNICLGLEPTKLGECQDYVSDTYFLEVEGLETVPGYLSSLKEDIESLNASSLKLQKAFSDNRALGQKAASGVATSQLRFAWDSMRIPENLDSYLERLEKDPGYNLKAREFANIYYNDFSNRRKLNDKEAAYKEYFEKIYPERDTIGKASVYPWRRFTEREVKKLVEKYNNIKEGLGD